MPNLVQNHTGPAFQQITMDAALLQLKTLIENAIQQGGSSAKTSVIRSQNGIKIIHDAVKSDLLVTGIHPSLINLDKKHLERVIYPPSRVYNRPRRLYDKEHKLAGYLKTKKQDISVIPRNIPITPTNLNYPTELNGYSDFYGDNLTEAILSINVRSQLSSTNKNYDTLYERTFAEPLNLHLRCPNMVLGELYLIMLNEYDSNQVKNNTVAYVQMSAERLEKYIKAFQAINGRNNTGTNYYHYERCCLLIVDFQPAVPIVYDTSAALIKDGYLPNTSTVTLHSLDYVTFISDLLAIYSTRFPNNTFS